MKWLQSTANRSQDTLLEHISAFLGSEKAEPGRIFQTRK